MVHRQPAAWEKVSLCDYPGRLCSVLFCSGCPFRCPFCYNRDLVLPERIEQIPERVNLDDVLSYLTKRRSSIGAVCVTGGEPLMSGAGLSLLRELRPLGIKVKLDTNGYYPEILQDVLTEGLVDYVAMDVKNCPDRYAETCGLPAIDLGRIRASIQILRGGKVPVMFRTTIVRELHRFEDLAALSDWGFTSEPIVFTSFESSPNLIGNSLTAYAPNELDEIVGKIRKMGFINVQLRGESAANQKRGENYEV